MPETHELLSRETLVQQHRQAHPGRSRLSTSAWRFGRELAPGRVWCRQQIPSEQARTICAVHEASHAVLGVALGLTLADVLLTPHRIQRGHVAGGSALFVPDGDAQHLGVALVAGYLAERRFLHRLGYTHPELDQCRRLYGAAGDWAEIAYIRSHGLLIDTDRASADVERLLDTPSITAAISTFATLLVREGRSNHDQVERLLTEHRVAPPTVWVPSQDDLLAHHGSTDSQERGTEAERGYKPSCS